MNKAYRLIWSRARGCWMVASEHARSGGKTGRRLRAVTAAAALVLAGPTFADAFVEESSEENESSTWVAAQPRAMYFSDPLTMMRAAEPMSIYRTQAAQVSDSHYTVPTIIGESLLLLGSRATMVGNYSAGFGNQAAIRGSYSTAIGDSAQALQSAGTAVGYFSVSWAYGATALGHRSAATAEYALALGERAGANAVNATAVGRLSLAQGAQSVALGMQTNADGVDSIAVGSSSHALGSQSFAAGARTRAEGQSAITIGAEARTNGNFSTAMGHQAKAGSGWANAVGYQAEAMGSSSIAVGSLSKSNASGSIALGDRAQVDTTGLSSMALGHYAAIGAGATNAVAIGSGSVASAADTVSFGSSSRKRRLVNLADGEVSASSTEAVTGRQLHGVSNRLDSRSVHLGESARPNGIQAVAIGYNAQVATNGGASGIAIGAHARGGSDGWSGGVAVGGAATSNFDSIALGYDAHAQAIQSVALGRGSIADVRDTVSVGNSSLRRRIVNVGDGTLSATSTDATTGKQLFATNQSVAAVTTTANTAKTTADAARVDATSALGKANLLSGLVGQSTPNGSMRLGAENTGTQLDVRNKGNSTRIITGVSGGSVSAASNEAVNGAQLFATNQSVAAVTTTANTAKTTADAARVDATSALGKANLLSGLVGQSTPNGSMRLGAENTGTQLDVRNKGNSTRIITGVSGGSVSAASNEAVNGDQLFATNQNVATVTTTANTAKTTADAAQVDATSALGKANLLSGLVGQSTPNGSMRLGAENTGSQLDIRNRQYGNRTVTGVAEGTIGASSSEAVNGRQLHATNQQLVSHAYEIATHRQAIGNNRADLDTLRVEFDGYIPDLSGVVQYSADRSSVDLGGARMSGLGDGAITATSAEAVNGSQLFTTDQNVSAARNTADTARLEATAALTKAAAVSGLISHTTPSSAVRLGLENTGNVLDVRNQQNGNRIVTGVSDGTVGMSSSEAVNGRQLHATNQQLANHAFVILENRRDIGRNRDDLDQLRGDFDGYVPDLDAVVKFSADRSRIDMEGARLTDVREGELSADSRDAVNGAQLSSANDRITNVERQNQFVAVGAQDFSQPANASSLGVAVGGDASAAAEGATAVGSFSLAMGANSVALGRGSFVAAEGEDGFALGTRTRVRAAGGLAVGAETLVLEGANHSIALGYGSVAADAETLSLGNDSVKRRIVNVARGIRLDDAATYAQLSESLAPFGAGAGLDATGHVIAPNYVLANGNFSNVGDALSSLDTRMVTHAGELDNLDSRYQALAQNDRMIRYNEDRSVVDFGGARVTGVVAGRLGSDSSDAVNGSQLSTTNDRVAAVELQNQFVAIGADDFNMPASSGILGVAVGGNANALAEGSTAVGSFSLAMGTNSVALGRGSYVSTEGEDGFALGTSTHVRAAGGLALGAATVVLEGADQSIALGYGSVVAEANTLSLGNDSVKRRIANVGRGIKSDDATTVSQLRGTLVALGGGADLDANGNVVGPRYAVQGSEYGSFGDAITALDGSVGNNRRNLETLDNRFQRLFQESPSANADGAGRLSFGGAQGMVLGNVANGLIGQGSRDAVNGGQLWAVRQDLQGQIDALEGGSAEVSGTPATMGARSASGTFTAGTAADATPVSAVDPVADTPAAAPIAAAQDPLVKAEGDNAVAVGSEGKERQVKHVAEGRADTDAANVRQVNDAMERANEYTDVAVAGVNQRLDHMDKRINRMAAISSAQSAMAMNTAGLQTANRLGAGVGYSEGESAMSVGYQRVLNERGSATFSLNGAFTNSGEKSVGVGMGIGW